MKRLLLRLLVPALILVVWQVAASGSARAPRPSTVVQSRR